MIRTPNILSLLALLVLTAMPALGNNISISNVQLPYKDTTGTPFARVQFDIQWENSWRRADSLNNWDAAWVFIKYRRVYESAAGATSSGTTVTVASTKNLYPGMRVRVTSGTGEFAAGTTVSLITSATQFTVSATPTTDLSSNAVVRGEGDWGHATLAASGHSTGSYTIDPRDNVGAFIYRDANGTGNFTQNGVYLQWNYSSNGIAGGDQVEVRVFAIEMVYVPQGEFYVGSGGTEANSLTQANSTSGNTVPFLITSSAPTIQGVSATSSASNLGARRDNSTSMDLTDQSTAALASGFPTGYAAFYCMKYEISQGQYRDFLNTLSRAQQNTRTGTSLGAGTTSVTNRYVMSNSTSKSRRNGLCCDSTIHTSDPITFYCNYDGNETANEPTDGEWIACNYLSWADGAAYCDWSGLRPMTELEYEKACRGPGNPTLNEYAWGSTDITQAAVIPNSEGLASESMSSGNAVNYLQQYGPHRVGVFAMSNTSRYESGASYWGIMELTGNLIERCVTVGNLAGRSYTGVTGNGTLTNAGDADVELWPGTGASGTGTRGGSYFSQEINLPVSDRLNAAAAIDGRNPTYGFRGVR